MVHIQEEFWDSQKEKQININSLTYLFSMKFSFRVSSSPQSSQSTKVFRKESRINLYLGRNMGCKKIFLLFVVRWCWWHSTPICPQLKLRDRILQVNCMNVYFSNALILKQLCSVFRLKMYWFFFLVHNFSLRIYPRFNSWHSFFFY